MKDVNNRRKDLPPRPTVILLVMALVFLFLGIFLSADLLVLLGPMRVSLTNDYPLTQRTAHFEVQLFRAFSILMSFSIAFMAIFWEKIQRSSIILNILQHNPIQSEKYRAIDRFLNPSLLVIISCAVLGLIYMSIGERIFTPDELMIINNEDGIMEYVTAILFLGCSVFSIFLAHRFSGLKSYALMFCLLSVGFVLFSGEEISWGQRILNVETSEFFSKYNVQQENNIHNMLGYVSDHLFIFGVFCYGFMFAMLRVKSNFFRHLFGYFGVPIPSPGLGVGFLTISVLHSWTIYMIFPRLMYFRVAEWRELMTAIGFCVLMYESWLLSQYTRE